MQVFWNSVLDKLDFLAIRFAKSIFARGGSPERIGRGLAAGVLGAFFPLSTLRFAAALLGALFFRGNRAVAMLPPLCCSLFEFSLLTRYPALVGGVIFGSHALELKQWAPKLTALNNGWSWVHPFNSLAFQMKTLAGLFEQGLTSAWLSGIVIGGGIAGALSYPFTVVFMSYFYDSRIRARIFKRRAEAEHVEPFDLPPAPALPPATDRPEIELYCGRRAVFLSAKRVRLLLNGDQVYPEMLAAIASAEKTVELETYIFRADHFGSYFAAALKGAARRGVKTRVVVDGFGSISLSDAFYAGLADAGVEVRVFHRLRSLWRRGMGFVQRRDHRKILVADGRISLLGGLNIADEYAAKAEGGGGWHDIHVRIDGEEIAAALQTIFNEAWRKAERPVISPTLALPQADMHAAALALEKYLEGRHTAARIVKFSSGKIPVWILSNRELLERMRIKRAYLRAVRAARQYILIENAFFIPDRGFLRALYRARKRGVAVGVVVAMRSDVQIAAMASRALYDEMLTHGVRLFEYSRNMVHGKVAAIDDRWSIVSSYNLNQRSLRHDLEVGALFFDENLAKAVRDVILDDIRNSNEITLPMHRARPWSIALWESFWYLFRHWL